MTDKVEVSASRMMFLTIAPWITVVGVVCAVVAGVLTATDGGGEFIRFAAVVAMVCAFVAGAGAVMHVAQGAKAVFAIAAIALLIAGSTFLGLTYSD